MPTTLSMKTQAHLEWPRICAALSEECHSSIAQAWAHQLSPLESKDAIERALKQVSEARALWDSGARLPLGHPQDVFDAVALATRGGTLDPDELIAIGVVMESSSRCRKFLEALDGGSPSLTVFVEQLGETPDLVHEMRVCFNERGELSNQASGELADLRMRVDGLHAQLKETVEGLVSDPTFDGMLQDDYFTIREERYVLPIRSGHKNHVDGIVHGWSGSGATVFIEPQKVVDANNRLVYAQAAVDKETRRILKQLSRMVGEQAHLVTESLTALCELDFIWAKARLSAKLGASAPQVTKSGSLCLQSARHPILVLKGASVVANDIVLDQGQSGLILTGPNTGGKTVALKTAGLAIAMALSGLHVPAKKGSTVPLTPSIFSDIGDEQSLDDNLSTFSGHMVNLNHIFRRLEPGSLVLLDELVVGTDPVQGAALAQALLERFVEKKALVIVTTHYETLKLLPYTDGRFRNGSMGYDPDSGLPSYRLSLDAPGASSALQTARRLGLDETIVTRAEALAGPEQHALQTVIEQLERERDTLHKLRTEAEAKVDRLNASQRAVDAKEARLRERLKKGIESEESTALTEARELRDELRSLRKSVRRKVATGDSDWLQQAQARASTAADELSQRQAAKEKALAGPELVPEGLEIGQKVWVVSLRTHGTLLSKPDSKGRCEVKAGIMTARVDLTDLRSNRFGKETQKRSNAVRQPLQAKKEPASWDRMSPQVPDNTLDLRGARVSEALTRAEKFLDDCYSRDFRGVYLIHGHGTGALKNELRSWLKTSAYIVDIRPGTRNEGGDGVTAILMRIG